MKNETKLNFPLGWMFLSSPSSNLPAKYWISILFKNGNLQLRKVWVSRFAERTEMGFMLRDSFSYLHVVLNIVVFVYFWCFPVSQVVWPLICDITLNKPWFCICVVFQPIFTEPFQLDLLGRCLNVQKWLFCFKAFL